MSPRTTEPEDWVDRSVPPVAGIRVGIGGWTFPPWRNNFYPKGLVQRRELEYASRHLSAIEINGTYYGAQKPATYGKWRDETPPGFVFSAKAPMRIMQSRALEKTGPQIEDFVGGIVERVIVWVHWSGSSTRVSAWNARALPPSSSCCPKPGTAGRCGMWWTCATRPSSMRG